MTLNFQAAQFISPKDAVELEYETVLVGKVLPKQGHTMMQKLSGKLGIEDLQHLKRIQKIEENGVAYLHVILCPSRTDNNSNNEDESIPDFIQKIISDLNIQPYKTQVPKNAPRSREQWEEWSKIWPVTYRPLDASMWEDQDPISVEKQQELEKFMRKCYELKQRACNAAIIVDPASGWCIAVGVDQEQHVLHHAVMLAIDQASKFLQYHQQYQLQQPSTVQKIDPPSSSSSKVSRPLECKEGQDIEQPQHKKLRTENNQQQVIQQEDMQTINQDGKTQCQQDNLISELPCSIPQLQNFDDQITCQECGLQLQKCKCQGSKQYLCTGYHCYVVQEPCIMCAMAMVHSRVSRVVYAVRDEKFGALGGQLNLMKEQTLNHHYDVYCLQPEN
eukprot:TRINITY_DN13899_c0_g1_i2.p1 TRINITY_DN13899_c0_g1~~TRINITY_DN13899_c0_g1_i2.p1  ORF type:complete len:389 (-),score=34.19 TRINITY_DN13899_c0_g1_i2:32-1198(-)